MSGNAQNVAKIQEKLSKKTLTFLNSNAKIDQPH